jgi:hypothetical protein
VDAVSAPPPPNTTVAVSLSTGATGFKKLLGASAGGEHRLTLTPGELVVEHGALEAPLRFAPGTVAVATVDHGPPGLGKTSTHPPHGRFPILHRLSSTAVVPREEGIEGWLWTNIEASAFLVLGDEAPNVAFVFSPPVGSERLEGVLTQPMLEDVAKRTPLGQPALFGLLLRTTEHMELAQAFQRYGFRTELTDREVPPTQRRHLPDDKPANPDLGALHTDRAKTSVAPPGFA